MSYQPYDRNPSGIVFFGTSASDQVFESNSNFTYDGSTLSVPNITIGDGGNIGSVSDPDAMSISSGGDVSFSQDVSVAGNLTVNGTTTTVNSTVVTIQDPIIVLGSNSGLAAPSDDNKDRGVQFNWHNGSVAKSGFFGFDDDTGKFTFVPDAVIAGEVVSGASGTIVANLQGNVDGNANTATALLNSRNFSISGEIVANAVSFNGTSNVSLNASIHESAITSQPAWTGAVDSTNDKLLIYDASATSLKQISRTDFVSGLGTMSSFSVYDGTTTVAVSDSETITFSDGTGAEFVISDVAGQPTITVNSVDSEIIHDNLSGFVANEHINHSSVTITAGSGLNGGGDITTSRTLNIGAGAGISVDATTVGLASSVAGSGLNYAAGVLNIGEGSLIDVNSTTISVDLTEAASATIANGDYLIFLDGGATGTASKGSTTGLASLMAGSGLIANGSTLDVQTDNATIEVNSDTLRVKDKGITEAKLNRTLATVSSVSATGTADITLLDATSNNVTLILPENGGTIGSGRMMTVKRIDNSANNVVISRQTADTIDGAATVQLYHRYETMTFVSDGSNWYII